MTIEEVILALINEHGSDVLKSKNRFLTLFQDYSKNFFSHSGDFLDLKACYDNGLWKFAKDIYDEKDDEKLAVLSRNAQRDLVDIKRLSSTSVISGINILLGAFGKNFELLQVEKVNNEAFVTKEIAELQNENDAHREDCSFIDNAPASLKRWFFERLSKALAGDIEAMLDVADCYRKGNVVQKNWRMAVRWYKDVIKSSKEDGSVNVEIAKEKLVELYNDIDENYYR